MRVLLLLGLLGLQSPYRWTRWCRRRIDSAARRSRPRPRLVGTAAQSIASNARLVQVSETLIDAALARNADDLFALATKEWALRERAARVEQDACRAAAFVQEADRVVARVRTLRSRTP